MNKSNIAISLLNTHYVEKYIPKQLRPYLVRFDKITRGADNTYFYNVTFSISGETYTILGSNTFSELEADCKNLCRTHKSDLYL